jgi:cytochrome c-type biogenesis protein CcmH
MPAAVTGGEPGGGPDGGAGEMPTAADITAMVDGLAARLAAEGGPPEDWARLIRSLGVLGRQDEAQAILAEARQRHAGDAPGLAAIEAAARDAGLAPCASSPSQPNSPPSCRRAGR